MRKRSSLDTTYVTCKKEKPQPKQFSFSIPTPAPELVGKQEEMKLTNEELEEAKSKYENWKTTFQEKKREIDGKRTKLSEQRENLTEFITHHNIELEKARTKERDETAKMQKIQADLERLKEEETFLKSQNDTLKNELDDLQPYADYLQEVVDSSSNFDSIESILNKYHSIEQTRQEYIEKYRELLNRFSTDAQKQRALLDLRKAYLIDRTMKYNESVNKVDQAKQQSEYRRMQLIKDIQRIEEKNVELSSIKTSIKTIYKRASDRATAAGDKIKKSPDQMTEEEMLTFIKNRFSDLSEIIKASKQEVYVNH